MGPIAAIVSVGGHCDGAFPREDVPKVAACLRFVRSGGVAVIASLVEVVPAMAGEAGTRIVPDDPSDRSSSAARANDRLMCSETAAAKAAALGAAEIPVTGEPREVPDLLRRAPRERHG